MIKLDFNVEQMRRTEVAVQNYEVPLIKIRKNLRKTKIEKLQQKKLRRNS